MNFFRIVFAIAADYLKGPWVFGANMVLTVLKNSYVMVISKLLDLLCFFDLP